MAEDTKNHFLYRRQFPDWQSILNRKGKSTKEIFEGALFVLDTNALLVPYNTGKDNLEEIREKYKKLVAQQRLFVPEHVLMEFAKNRSVGIQELFTQIDNQLSSLPHIKQFEYPILEGLIAYDKLNKAKNSIASEVKEYKKVLEDLRSEIIDWNWSDPVTNLYQEVISPNCIIKPVDEEEDLIRDYHERIKNDIPPGNKDKSKDVNAIGDFVIWRSILELGKVRKKDVIFVSNDEKNDWLLKGNKKSISTRFELVDEFYRYSDGCNFISINFTKFLELQGLDISINETIVWKESNYDNFAKFLEAINFKYKYTEKALVKISIYIESYLKMRENGDDREYSYIEGEDLNEYINAFIKSYESDYSDSKSWILYQEIFQLLENLLVEIMSFNDIIILQEKRMKVPAHTEEIKLEALCREFIKQYNILSVL